MNTRMQKVREALALPDPDRVDAAFAEVEEWEAQQARFVRYVSGPDAVQSISELTARVEAAEAELARTRLVVSDREEAAQHAILERIKMEAERDEQIAWSDEQLVKRRALEAERDRFREALEQIARELPITEAPGGLPAPIRIERALIIARAAVETGAAA